MTDRAVIVDRGYRGYDDVRLGHRAAIRAMIREGFRQVLGFRRKARRKVFPWTLIAITLVMAAVLIGVHWAAGVALGPVDPDLPSYGQFFDMISVITLLFMALAAPHLLVPDRTESVLNVYLSRPLRMSDYLTGKLGALAVLGLSFFLVPQTILHIGLATLSDNGFLSYLGANLDVLWKVPVTSVVYVTVYGALALAVAALIPRVGFAAGIFLAGILQANGVAEFVVQLDITGARFASFLAVEQLPRVVRDWIFDIRTSDYVLTRVGFDPWMALAAAAAVAMLSGLIVWARYRRLP